MFVLKSYASLHPRHHQGGPRRVHLRHRGITEALASTVKTHVGHSRCSRPGARAVVPTLALVQGGCFGGGTGIIAACDVVIAADNT